MTEILNTYTLTVNSIDVDVTISTDVDRSVPFYEINIQEITENTKLMLNRVRQDFIDSLDISELEHEKFDENEDIRDKFKSNITDLIDDYFPKADEKTKKTLINYLLQENLGLGRLEILLQDSNLEELVVNNHKEPVKIYHKEHGWVETSVQIETESQIRHYATMIGRQVNKEITNLKPLLDARLQTGDRVNATLEPISSEGNTITIRKFAEDPWTITKFLKLGTIGISAAAFIWLAVENELSMLIAGGTGSGKTSMLNVVANFLPPGQRIISIEDTRELQLPVNLHWVPMETREPNPEGKGGVSMLDLVINSLRMRPDRIVVGEIRRQEEAQTLVEAMLTGHSCYATVHANSAEETITRLTNPPIDIPQKMVSAIDLLLVQNRNRRSGDRHTLQVAEVTDDGEANVLLQYNPREGYMEKVGQFERLLDTLELYTGLTKQEIQDDLYRKEIMLRWLVDNDVDHIHNVGRVMSRYYTDRVDVEPVKQE
jgi:flagellar protein FlaI